MSAKLEKKRESINWLRTWLLFLRVLNKWNKKKKMKFLFLTLFLLFMGVENSANAKPTPTFGEIGVIGSGIGIYPSYYGGYGGYGNCDWMLCGFLYDVWCLFSIQ